MLHSSRSAIGWGCTHLRFHQGVLMRKAARIVLVFALVVGIRPAAAQQTTGTIAGVVVDVQGAAVPGATATASSAQDLRASRFTASWCGCRKPTISTSRSASPGSPRR